jgi:hypothetical protein
MDSGLMQRLVDIDIAKSGHDSLIQEQGFQNCRSTRQAVAQIIRRKRAVERLWPEVRPRKRSILSVSRHEVDPPKFALIVISELSAIIELEDEPEVRSRRILARSQQN